MCVFVGEGAGGKKRGKTRNRTDRGKGRRGKCLW